MCNKKVHGKTKRSKKCLNSKVDILQIDLRPPHPLL